MLKEIFSVQSIYNIVLNLGLSTRSKHNAILEIKHFTYIQEMDLNQDLRIRVLVY